MRMRTVREAHKELRAADPKCGLGLSGLYKLVSSGDIPSVRVGQKYLLDLDYLEEYLSGMVETRPSEATLKRAVENGTASQTSHASTKNDTTPITIASSSSRG